MSHTALGKAPAECFWAFAGSEVEGLQALWVGLHATMEPWPDRPPEANLQLVAAKLLLAVQPDVSNAVHHVAKAWLAALLAAQDINTCTNATERVLACLRSCACRPAST